MNFYYVPSPFPSYCILHTKLSIQVLSPICRWGGRLREGGYLIQGHTAGKCQSPGEPGHLISSLILCIILGHCPGREQCGWDFYVCVVAWVWVVRSARIVLGLRQNVGQFWGWEFGHKVLWLWVWGSWSWYSGTEDSKSEISWLRVFRVEGLVGWAKGWGQG